MKEKLKKVIVGLSALIGMVALSSCGARVEVPVAHYGKIKTANGIENKLIVPSTFRLPFDPAVKNELILVEGSDFPIEETMKLFMPHDQLNLDFDLRATLAISSEGLDGVFDRVPAKQGTQSNTLLITANSIYEIYGRQLIRQKVRSLMSEYSIQEVMEQREAISQELSDNVTQLFQEKGYPISVIHLGLADIQPPVVIVEAQEAAKEREIAIQRAEADKAVKLKEAEANYEVAVKQQQIDLLEAETQVLVEQKLSEAVNTAFVTQRTLKIWDQMSQNSNKQFFMVTPEAFTKPELLIGPHIEAVKTHESKE